MYGTKSVGRPPKFMEKTASEAKTALDELFVTPEKKNIDESWLEAEFSNTEWQDIVPGKRFFDLSLDRNIFGVRIATLLSGGKTKLVRLDVLIDSSVLKSLWGESGSDFRLTVQGSKTDPWVFKIDRGMNTGFKVFKAGKGMYKVSFNTMIKPDGKNTKILSRYVKFKKMGKSLIIFANQPLEA